MSPTWHSDDLPTPRVLGFSDWLRVALRGGTVVFILLVGVFTIIVLRLVEWPLFRARRPWTGWITVWVCRLALKAMGIKHRASGTPMTQSGAIVANHSSWLDIFVLNAGAPLYFVAKAEVAGWAGIGWLARLTGTVFVRRDRRDAGKQREVFEQRFRAGHRLLFFPEGTSTDGKRVLAFKPTLFAGLFAEGLRETLQVQPATVTYFAPEDQDPRFYGWWGDMEFGSHMIQMLAARSHGAVEVTWHEQSPVTSFADRKEMARLTEAAVRSAHPNGKPAP